MKAAVNAKLRPKRPRSGSAAPSKAPSVVEAVHMEMFTSPEPMRNGAPTSGDFARSDIVKAQFSSPVMWMAKSFFLSDKPANTSVKEAMMPT